MKNSNRVASYHAVLLGTVGCLLVATPSGSLAQQAGASPTAGPQTGAGAAASSAITAVSPSSPTAPAGGAGIEDIVVTARHSSESAQRVPIAITTVSAQGLTDLSIRDISEVQKITPGLYITSSGSAGRARLTLRGQTEVDSRLTSDPSVGVYVDGVNYARDYGLRSSLVDIERIEVLKGPQGTLFGKNTTGGALNITTAHPTYDLSGYGDALYGSYNNVQVLGVVNAPLVKDKLAIRLVGQRIKRDGYGDGINGQEVGDDDVWTGRALLRADPAEYLHILLSADSVWQRNSQVSTILVGDSMLANANSATGALGAIAKQLGLNPASAADRMTAYNAWRGYFNANSKSAGGFQDSAAKAVAVSPRFYDNVTHYGFSSNIGLDLGAVNARSITAYRHLTRDLFQDPDATPFDLQFIHQTTTEKNLSQEFQLSSIDGVGLDWQIGLFYNRETGNEFSVSNLNDYISANRPVVQDADVKNVSKAAYAQAVYNFSDKVRLTGGVRYTKDTRDLDSKNRTDPTLALPPVLAFPAARCNLLTPTLGGPVYPDCTFKVSTGYNKATWLVSADWRPVHELMLYGSVSTGYRAGGFTYQGASSVQTSVAAINAVFAPFLPENVRNYEIGFKSDLLDRKLRINGSFYYEDYKDIQARVRDRDATTGQILQLFRNAAKATFYGGELEVTAKPTRRLTLDGSLSYFHGKYDEFRALDAAGNLLDLSSQPIFSPKWTYSMGAAYVLPIDNGSIRANVNWAWTGTVILDPAAIDRVDVTQHHYGLLDGRISWHIDSIGLDLAVFSKNLTAKKYLSYVTNSEANGWITGIPGSPRTFGVQVRKTF